MPDSEAKKEWMRKNARIISIKMMLKGDADILEFLQDKPTATTIKAALREYMKNHKEENKMYTVKSEFIDNWFGSASTDEIEEAQEKGFTAEDISRLARDWGVSVEDLMEQVEEA